jgi:hypothetical protein
VLFVMRDLDATAPRVSSPATIIGNPTTGNVAYYWLPGDTSIPGTYDAVWLATYPDGTQQSFPTDGYLEVEVQLNLATAGVQTRSRPTDGIRPRVSDVGALLAQRGKGRNGVQFGTDSKPSYVQVAGIISQMASEVDAELAGVKVTPKLASYARYAITLGAAATVELTFWPEQASNQGSTSGILWSRYQGALSRFRELLKEEGGGPPAYGAIPATSPTLSAYNEVLANPPLNDPFLLSQPWGFW